MRISYVRGLLLTLVALLAVVAVGVLVITGSHKEAKAQATKTTEEEAFRAHKYLERMKPQLAGNATGIPETSAAQATARQGVVTTAARSKLPGLGPQLISKAGLGGVAAGVWIHNGIILWDGYQCGQPSCPGPLPLDAQFRQAIEADQAGNTINGGGSSFKWSDYNGNEFASGMVTGFSYQYFPATNTCRYTINWNLKLAPGKANGPPMGNEQKTNYGSSCTMLGGGTTALTATKNATENNLSPIGYNQSFVTDCFQSQTTNTCTKKYFGPNIYRRTNADWKNPIYDWGQTDVVATAPTINGGPFKASVAQSHDFYQAVAADEADQCSPTSTTADQPETCPNYFPPAWEDDPGYNPNWNPYDPEIYPNDDPDGDGVPNLTDKYPADPAKSVHPWEEMPERLPEWGNEPWHEVEPFGGDEYDGRIFGEPEFNEAIYHPEEDMYSQRFKDGTVRETWIDETGHVIDRYENSFGPEGAEDIREIWRIQGPGGTTYFYFRNDDLEGEWHPIGACADSHVGEHVTMRVDRWEGNGVYRIRLFSDTQDAHDAQNSTTLCNNWYDANDQGISAPPDLTDYPEEVLTR